MHFKPMEPSVHSDSQDLLSELRTFIAGAARVTDTNQLSLVKTALSLLNTLPAARDAVLEYFYSVFHNYVSRYLTLLENGSLTIATSNDSDILLEEEIPLIEIQNVLCNFVVENTESWAPILSTWSLELLGDISSKHGSHSQIGSTLNERLQLWTVCGATRTLLDINTQCMTRLMYSNSETCINALLDMSVIHSPHFDWVVVHVGSSFPGTVITKVLSCGLKDFYNNEQVGQTPKLNSVVGILGHLANTHFTDIKNALINLFHWSLEETSKGTSEDKYILRQKIATVPYLLHLASLSPVLLKALSADSLQSLNMNVLMRLSTLATDWWCYFQTGRQGLLDLIVHLLLYLENGIYHILTILFRTASFAQPELLPVSLTAQEIIELLISEMDLLLRITNSTPPLIRSFYSHMPSLKRVLLLESPLKSSYATRFFVVLGKYDSRLLSSCIAYLLNRATEEVQIERLIELTRSLNDKEFFGYGFGLALQYESFENVEFEETNWSLILWKNVHTLLKQENKIFDSGKPVSQGLTKNLSGILNNVKEHEYDIVTFRIVASVLYDLLADIPRTLSVEETMALTEVSVSFFYSCITCINGDVSKLKDCQLANNLLVKSCLSSDIGRTLAIRLLVEIAVYPPISPIFGAVVKPDPETILPVEVSLLKENITQGNTLMVAQSAMSVFHTGIIGSGLREIAIKSNLTADGIKSNTQYLMNALRSCCLSDSGTVSLDAVTNLALLLVQLISPDVMFNGLPWPEEEFCKVTVERDLCIRKAFDSTPLLWTLLKFTAIHRPTLCYCSVLLRAITATLMAQWSSASQGRSAKPNVLLVDTTLLLLETLSLGQLLPPPLSGLTDIVPYLIPSHVLLIFRECVWNYMRDHVPSPALFTKDGNGVMWRDPALSKPTKQYTETLRIVLLNNISKLGSLYRQLFMTTNAETD